MCITRAVHETIRRLAARLLLLSLAMTGWSVPALRAEPKPVLQIDAGGHQSLIRAVAFTPDGRFLVSASDDKTIRVWDFANGRTERIIRSEIGPGNLGKNFAIAISPDGHLLASAGWHDGSGGSGAPCCGDIRLHDLRSGEMVGRLSGHTNAVNALAFSPDGRNLVSGSSDATALIWNMEAREISRVLSGHNERINAIAFLPGGQEIVSAGHGGELNIWSTATGERRATLGGHKAAIMSLAIAADGTIATGDRAGEIRVWSARDGRLQRRIQYRAAGIGSLSLDKTGSRLVASCGLECGDDFAIRVFDPRTGDEIARHEGHDNIVLATALAPDGTFAASGGGRDHEIRLWNVATGKTLHRLAGLGRSVWAVGFAPDGRSIAWGNDDPCPKLSSCPNKPGRLSWQIRLPKSHSEIVHPAKLDAGGTKFTRAVSNIRERSLIARSTPTGLARYSALDYRVNGKTLSTIERSITDGVYHTAFSFSGSGSFFFSGTVQGQITAYFGGLSPSIAGQAITELEGHMNEVWALAASTDGRFLLSGGADQTVRLWNIEPDSAGNIRTGELVVTLFRADDNRWLMWTPQGYYMGSGGADKLIGWHLNRGPDQAPDFIRASQLHERLHRPDIVKQAIALGSAARAVAEARSATFKLEEIFDRPLPGLRIVDPQNLSNVSAASLPLKIEVASTTPPARLLRATVNGMLVVEQVATDASGSFPPGQQTVQVPLEAGSNNIRISLLNDIGQTTADVEVFNNGLGALDHRGVLHILAIGVDIYPKLPPICGDTRNESCNLRFAGRDAASFAAAVERRLSAHHSRVQKTLLVAGQSAQAPTYENIVDALGRLRRSSENDTVVVFLAGHGVNDGGDYLFLPTDAAIDSTNELRPSSTVPWWAIESALKSAKGRRVLFVDTCHGGNAYNDRLDIASANLNVITYAASRWDQAALEREDLEGGHGLFTFAVVEGLLGKAGARLTTVGLHGYVRDRVEGLARAMQRAQDVQYFRARDAEDFVLAK